MLMNKKGEKPDPAGGVSESKRAGQELVPNSLYIPHHYYLYGLRPKYSRKDINLHHNSMGYRGKEISPEKPSNVFRIVFIGGSTVYGTGVGNNDKVFTSILEARLDETLHGCSGRVEVLNCGVPGATSAENLIRFVFSVSQLNPDVVCIQQGANDAFARTYPELSSDYAEYSKSWSDPNEGGTGIQGTIRRLIDLCTRRKRVADLATYVRKEAPRSPEYVLRNGAGFFVRNQVLLAMLAKHLAGEAIFLTDHMFSRRLFPFSPGRNAATIEHNQLTKEVAERTGSSFFDLNAALYPHDIHPDHRISIDRRHPNEKGEELKAKLLLEWFLGTWHLAEKIQTLMGQRTRGDSAQRA